MCRRKTTGVRAVLDQLISFVKQKEEAGQILRRFHFPGHTPLVALAPLSSPKGAFALRPRSRERPWVPACAGMTMAPGVPCCRFAGPPWAALCSPSPYPSPLPSSERG